MPRKGQSKWAVKHFLIDRDSSCRRCNSLPNPSVTVCDLSIYVPESLNILGLSLGNTEKLLIRFYVN